MSLQGSDWALDRTHRRMREGGAQGADAGDRRSSGWVLGAAEDGSGRRPLPPPWYFGDGPL